MLGQEANAAFALGVRLVIARTAAGGRWLLALICAVVLLGGATGALAAQPLIPRDPVKSQWRKVVTAKDGRSVHYIPAGMLEAIEDGITTTVTMTVKLDRRGRPTGYMVMTLAVGCEKQRYAIGDIDIYDADAQLKDSSRGTKANIAPEPIVDGSVIQSVSKIVCSAPILTRPQKPQGARPRTEKSEAPQAESQLSSGTGWLSDQGYIVTAAHVVDGAQRIILYQEGAPIGEARVVVEDPENDVAILRPSFDVSRLIGLKLRSRPATLGQHVFTLGYPLADILGVRSVKMASGDITGLTGVGASGRPDDPRYAQISIPVQSGNSGGPIIDAQGGVAGIVIAKASATETELLQNVNFALKASYISALLAELPPASKPRVVDPANPDRVAAVKGGIFLIVVESQ